MFRPVSSKVNFPRLEKDILSFWKKEDIFNKSVKKRENSKLKFTLYEGPPTANGKPGIHHVLSRVYKDVIPRYKVMKGYYTPRIAGWDTHGLPVELEIERKLGLSSKSDIENYGIAKFNALCRESVFTYLKEWNTLTERIGFWLDIEHPYITLNNSYIESVWWAIKQLWDKNLIYQGYRVTPHCPRCETSLSSHEVALGYKDDTVDPSVSIKFKLAIESIISNIELANLLKFNNYNKPIYFLAWTTTPWTLPGNTALAVSAESEYAILEGNDEYIIMANSLIEKIGLEGYQVKHKILGKSLIGLRYEPLFNPHEYNAIRQRFKLATSEENNPGSFQLIKQPPSKELTYPVISGDFVTMDEGTGIVHIAPAFGEVDFEAGKMYGLDFVQHVNLEGKVTGEYPFSGKFVKEADPIIIEILKSRRLLYKAETVIHTYPFCWRCDTPVLYYAKKSWYIKTTAKKKELIEGNNLINWYPEHIKYGRFGDWLQNNVDWAFSRERYWGTPLNIWACKRCGKYDCIGSLNELKTKSGLKGWQESLDLHRPYIDDVSFNCDKCGGLMQRQTEVIDCWFDSGAMPFAQWHYPFENISIFKERFPADYISEAVDQTRGWFYSLHAISILLMDSPCFKNVICLGHVLDAKGEKMSKTKGNVVDPWSVLDKYGADSVRWYLITSSPPGNVKRFSADSIAEIQRNFLMTLWNVYSFFIMYANIDNINPKNIVIKPTSDLDVWVLSLLNKLIIDVDYYLENYDPTSAGRRIEDFIDNLSNWYVRRSRRRFWKSQNDEDKLSAYYTLYNCLVTVSKLLAPFMPFVAEEIYLNLVYSVDPDAVNSVHLTDFPIADRSAIDEDLINITKVAVSICSLGRAARAKAGIKVRQPLSKAIIKVKSEYTKNRLQKLSTQIMDEINVKDVEFVNAIDNELSEEFVVMEEGDICVAINKKITHELEAEGIAREIVRRIQVMRRTANYDITDHINIYYLGDDLTDRTIKQFSDYIKQETLAVSIYSEMPSDGIYSEKHKFLSADVIIGIKKAT